MKHPVLPSYFSDFQTTSLYCTVQEPSKRTEIKNKSGNTNGKMKSRKVLTKNKLAYLENMLRKYLATLIYLEETVYDSLKTFERT